MRNFETLAIANKDEKELKLWKLIFTLDLPRYIPVRVMQNKEGKPQSAFNNSKRSKALSSVGMAMRMLRKRRPTEIRVPFKPEQGRVPVTRLFP